MTIQIHYTNTLWEDVLVETEDENNMNVREVLELEDEMAQDDMNAKLKDMFEETAEVENNVSDVQEQEMVSSNSSKKVKGNIVITNHLIKCVHMSVCNHNFYQYDPVAI